MAWNTPAVTKDMALDHAGSRLLQLQASCPQNLNLEDFENPIRAQLSAGATPSRRLDASTRSHLSCRQLSFSAHPSLACSWTVLDLALHCSSLLPSAR